MYIQCTRRNHTKGRCKKHPEGGYPFSGGLPLRMVPPHFRRHLCTPPHFWWSSGVPPISDEHLMSPPISKNIFFQKVCMRFATFLHYPKRLDFIKYEVLCHWISLIWMTKSANKLIWMVKTLKLGDLRAQREKIFGYFSRPPPLFPVF